VRAKSQDGRLVLDLDPEKIKGYLQTTIAPEADKDVVLPRFDIKNGKVTSWQTGQNGTRLIKRPVPPGSTKIFWPAGRQHPGGRGKSAPAI